MSYRLYIIPADASAEDYPAADVILRQGGDVTKAAEAFLELGGPWRICTPNRGNATFLALVAELTKRGMEEDGSDYSYSVYAREYV